MKRFVAIICSIMCAAGFATAQDLNITGAGARAEGFGGAFIGVADDATAIVWNPAGLTQLERAEASVVTRFIKEKSEYSYAFYPESNTTLDQSHFVFNFGSFALPFTIGGTKVVLAAAFQRQLDFYLNQKTTNSETESKGGVNTITPGLSVRLSPVLSLGAAANIWTGTWDETVKGTPPSVQTNSLTQDFKGFNMVFGGLADLEGLPKPVPLKFGVTVRTPFEMTSDGNINYSPAISGVSTLPMSLTAEMPFMIGFGTSFRLGDNFTIAADYEIRSYGNKQLTQKFGTADPVNIPLSASKENLSQYRFGAEYLIVAQNYVIPVRAGYKNVPTTEANIDASGNTSQAIGKAWSVGSGYISNAFAIDVTYTMSDYTTDSYTTDVFGLSTPYSLKYTTGTISSSLIVYF